MLFWTLRIAPQRLWVRREVRCFIAVFKAGALVCTHVALFPSAEWQNAWLWNWNAECQHFCNCLPAVALMISRDIRLPLIVCVCVYIVLVPWCSFLLHWCVNILCVSLTNCNILKNNNFEVVYKTHFINLRHAERDTESPVYHENKKKNNTTPGKYAVFMKINRR